MNVCVDRVCGPVSGVGGAVEHPDCLVVETVFELADFGLETLQSLS